jgi:GR25 family glycosyltransferase involved in LPS biosynthesis
VRLTEIPTYVVHGRRLVDRYERLSAALAAQGMEAEWVTYPDISQLTRPLLRRYYRKSRRFFRARAAATPVPDIGFRRLTPAETAATISHIEIYHMLAESDHEWALILEDDAVFEEDFGVRFDEYMGDLPADADIVFIGDAYGLRIDDPDPEQRFHRKDHPASKCTDSYLIRRSAAAALESTIVPFAFPIDWELNYHLMTHDLAVYWLEPPLVSQGSAIGLYASTIAHDRRNAATRLQKLRLAGGRAIRAVPGGATLLRLRVNAAQRARDKYRRAAPRSGRR